MIVSSILLASVASKFKNIFELWPSCLTLALETECLSYWYKQNKKFLGLIIPAEPDEKHKDQWGLIWQL